MTSSMASRKGVVNKSKRILLPVSFVIDIGLFRIGKLSVADTQSGGANQYYRFIYIQNVKYIRALSTEWKRLIYRYKKNAPAQAEA